MIKLSLAVLTVIISACAADIYMHNPRGSNNRLDEAGRARNNGNRMFDSQNNDRGGYNVGSLYYYSGSQLPVEWTNQHSCGGPNNHCELILQYMCDDNVRDGATTTTIPENPAQCEGYNCNTDLRYGMNEDYDYYMNCKKRQRNGGLFLADQKLKGNTAKYTRQNPAGTRRGYECPEERDYYPYWHSSPWRDIAVLTNDVSRCKYYQAESQNVKERYECVVPYMKKMQNANNKRFVIPNNEEECKAWRWPTGNPNGTQAEWKKIPAHDIPPPVCKENEFSRDNHLGNGIGGYPNLFNLTIPDHMIHDKCVMRIRYNVSTAEFDGWDSSVNASLNEVRNNRGSLVDLSPKFTFATMEEAKARGYVLENNPQIAIFQTDKFKLELAVNTAQYGRTFQDRSHVMTVRQRSDDIPEGTLYNLNVRGKRGNIVQVYPAVEYDMVPNTLRLSQNDYVHIQWTGSNTNPKNNDGQGLAGTDRSNMLLQAEPAYPEDFGSYWSKTVKLGHWGRSFPQMINEEPFLGLTQADREQLAILRNGQFRGELSELDDAGTYFDLGPRKMTESATAHYMCSRNNNFSNRSQKGKIIVLPYRAREVQIGATGGSFALPANKALLTVKENTLSGLTLLSMEEWPRDMGQKLVEDKGGNLDAGEDYASDFIVVKPERKLTLPGNELKVKMKIESANNVKIYKSNSNSFASWEEKEYVVDGEFAVFETNEGGVFVARYHTNTGLVAGVVVAILIVAVVLIGTIVYFRRKPEKLTAVRNRMRKAQRSTQRNV